MLVSLRLHFNFLLDYISFLFLGCVPLQYESNAALGDREPVTKGGIRHNLLFIYAIMIFDYT